MTKLLDDATFEVLQLYCAIRDKWRESRGDEHSYMQGQKDGIRKTMALMGDVIGQENAEDWKRLQESSIHPTQYATRLEILEAQVKDAYRMMDVLRDGTYREIKQDAREFVEWVKRTKSIKVV